MKTALRIVLKREASRKNSVFGRTAAGHIANCRRYVGAEYVWLPAILSHEEHVQHVESDEAKHLFSGHGNLSCRQLD